MSSAAKTRFPTDNTERESGHGENNRVAVNGNIGRRSQNLLECKEHKMHEHNHPDGFPNAIFIRINASLYVTSVHIKSPPVRHRVTNNIASGPEEQ